MRPSKLFNPCRLREIGLMRRWLRSVPDGFICDIGCGDGDYTRVLARRHKAFGFDPWKSQVRKAARKYAKAADKVSFLVADAAQAPYQDAVFEAAVSVCVFEHIPDVDNVFREAYRLLKPGGLLLFTVDSLDEPHVPPGYVHYQRPRYYIAQFLPC